MTELAAAWIDLESRAPVVRARRIADLFRAEPDRMGKLSLAGAGIRLDISKQPWSLDDFKSALNLADAAGLERARARLFGGEIVNASEGRPAMHMALRAPEGARFVAGGTPVSREVTAMRRRIGAFSEAIRSSAHVGATGRPFQTVIHIGIGGSDLGPRLVWEALRPLVSKIDLRFVANVDPSDLALALVGLDPAETLVVVVSKTFTTQETLTNAVTARAWLREALGPTGDTHLVAVSAAPRLAQDFGVPQEQTFAFWDWVGGRYSLWSAVGLSCAIALGFETFEGLLAGGVAMDAHFQAAPLEANLPVVLALAHIFNRNVLDRPMRAVIPYAQRLRLFPAFLQQLEMESNGKRVMASGDLVTRPTAASVFGDAGTNGQHAFFQALHQGTDVIPVDFLAIGETIEGDPAAHAKVLASVIAQAEALMVGRSADMVRADLVAQGLTRSRVAALTPQKTFPGNRPSSFLVMDRLDAQHLGALIALYEHKVFVEGVIWGINSFDQWGVELGKSLTTVILSELEGRTSTPHDPSTTDLIARLKS